MIFKDKNNQCSKRYMKKKYLLILFLFSVIKIAVSQEQQKTVRKFLYGNLKDAIGNLYNAHIINLTTKQGTFTNQAGEFRVLASVNDSLKISFVGYKSIRIKVSANHFGIQKNSFILSKETFELDEVTLKRHQLKGRLFSDLKEVTTNFGAIKSKKAVDFSMIDFNQIVISKIDATARIKASDMRKQVDPTARFEGVSTKSGAGIDQYAAEKRRLRKEIQFKEHFPKILLSEFGEKFFFIELKIPKEKYHHFLNYCNYLGIEELYKKGRVLEMLKILQQQSDNYLIILNSAE